MRSGGINKSRTRLPWTNVPKVPAVGCHRDAPRCRTLLAKDTQEKYASGNVSGVPAKRIQRKKGRSLML